MTDPSSKFEFWQWLLEHGAQIGPLISGASLFIGSIAAWVTYIGYHRATLKNLRVTTRDQWVSDFRAIFAEFWDNERIAKARGWITSDKEYQEILQPILSERMNQNNPVNNFSETQNQQLELFDRFLALLTRVVSFDKSKMDEHQLKLWVALFEGFWIPRLYDREETRPYVKAYFKYLYDETFDDYLKKKGA